MVNVILGCLKKELKDKNGEEEVGKEERERKTRNGKKKEMEGSEERYTLRGLKDTEQGGGGRGQGLCFGRNEQAALLCSRALGAWTDTWRSGPRSTQQTIEQCGLELRVELFCFFF